jgi:anti-sigma B factor antagonist
MNVKIIQSAAIFDSTYTHQLRAEIEQLVKSGVQYVLIDFQDTTFMDSLGLVAVIETLKQLRQVQGRLALCAMTPQVRMLFELTDTLDVFEVFRDRVSFEQSLSVCA